MRRLFSSVGSICSPNRDPPSGTACCLPIDILIDLPDLAIYSQVDELARGRLPTWNSVDITMNRRSPWQLLQEPTVRIRNLSTSAGAVNASVSFVVSRFGIGTPPMLQLMRKVSVGADSQVELSFSLAPEIVSRAEQSVTTTIIIEHELDQNLSNNSGADAAMEKTTSQEGRVVRFPFEMRDDVSLNIVEPNLSDDLSPEFIGTNVNPPGLLRKHLELTVPDSLHGSSQAPIDRVVTVMGLAQNGQLVGGITCLLRIDD